MKRLPNHVQTLLWDMDSSKLDIQKHADAIIERVLNAGTLGDWKWLVSHYGEGAVRARLSQKSAFRRDNIRSESRRLASLILK